MSQLKTKLTAIKADYDDSCKICDQLMGISNEPETPNSLEQESEEN